MATKRTRSAAPKQTKLDLASLSFDARARAFLKNANAFLDRVPVAKYFEDLADFYSERATDPRRLYRALDRALTPANAIARKEHGCVVIVLHGATEHFVNRLKLVVVDVVAEDGTSGADGATRAKGWHDEWPPLGTANTMKLLQRIGVPRAYLDASLFSVLSRGCNERYGKYVRRLVSGST